MEFLLIGIVGAGGLLTIRALARARGRRTESAPAAGANLAAVAVMPRLHSADPAGNGRRSSRPGRSL